MECKNKSQDVISNNAIINFMDLPAEIIYMISEYCGIYRYCLAATCCDLRYLNKFKVPIPKILNKRYFDLSECLLENVEFKNEPQETILPSFMSPRYYFVGRPIKLSIIWIFASEAKYDELVKFTSKQKKKSRKRKYILRNLAQIFLRYVFFDNIDYFKFYVGIVNDYTYFRGKFANDKVRTYFMNYFRDSYDSKTMGVEKIPFIFMPRAYGAKIYNMIICDRVDDYQKLYDQQYFIKFEIDSLPHYRNRPSFNDQLKVAAMYGSENCFLYILNNVQYRYIINYTVYFKTIKYGTDNMFETILNYLVKNHFVLPSDMMIKFLEKNKHDTRILSRVKKYVSLMDKYMMANIDAIL